MIGRYEMLSNAVASIYHDIQRIERVEMAQFGLKGPHAQCLLVLKRHPEGMTAVQLCELCEKDKAAISRILAELEQCGMVCRSGQNGCRYRALLTLTEQGFSAAESVSQRAQVAVEQAGMGLEEEQRQVFYQVLALISRNLHTLCKDGLNK